MVWCFVPILIAAGVAVSAEALSVIVWAARSAPARAGKAVHPASLLMTGVLTSDCLGERRSGGGPGKISGRPRWSPWFFGSLWP